MSNKFPMVSLDKVEVKLTMKVETVVLVDRISKESGLSRAAIINGYVEDKLKEKRIKLTLDDLKQVELVKKENIAKRQAKKAQKGSR